MQPGWCQPVGQEFMENECEALPGVAYPGVRDNRSTLNTKTGYDELQSLNTLTLANRRIIQCVVNMYCTAPTLRHGLRNVCKSGTAQARIKAKGPNRG